MFDKVLNTGCTIIDKKYFIADREEWERYTVYDVWKEERTIGVSVSAVFNRKSI